MADMIALVASWFPDRKFMLVIDSLYSGKSVLSKLPKNFDMIEATYIPSNPRRIAFPFMQN